VGEDGRNRLEPIKVTRKIRSASSQFPPRARYLMPVSVVCQTKKPCPILELVRARGPKYVQTSKSQPTKGEPERFQAVSVLCPCNRYGRPQKQPLEVSVFPRYSSLE